MMSMAPARLRLVGCAVLFVKSFWYADDVHGIHRRSCGLGRLRAAFFAHFILFSKKFWGASNE